MPVPAGLPSEIVSMITASLKQRIVAQLQTPFAEDDLTRVDKVGIGRLQENTLANGVVMMIRPYTEIESHELSQYNYIETPSIVIGNGKLNTFYVRPVVIELSFFFKASEGLGDGDFESTANVGNVIIKRLHHMIHTQDWISGMADSFGEGVWHAPIVRGVYSEEGGSKRGTTNYRGDMIVDFFTFYVPT